MSCFAVFSNWIVDGCAALIDSLPANCSLCGGLCHASSLCPRCVASLPRPRQVCKRCGLELPASPEEEACGFCALHAPIIERSLSLLRYESPADHLIAGFKFHQRLADGKTLALLLAEHLGQHYKGDFPDLIIPVPLHLKRWQQRGYNQALEISKIIARQCRIDLAARLIERNKMTAPQTSLPSAAARRRNLSKAFVVLEPEALRGVERVAIVDDVITTMATVDALSKCLNQAGVKHIHAWSLARAAR